MSGVLHPCCAPRICLRCLIMDPDSIDPLEGDLPGDNFLPIEGRFSRLGSSAHSTVCGLQLGQPSWVSSQRQPSSAVSSQPPLPPCNFSSTNQYAVAISQTTLPSCFKFLQKPGPQRWALSTLTPTSITTKLQSPPTLTVQGAKCMPSLARTLTDSSGPTFSVHGTSSSSAIFPGT